MRNVRLRISTQGGVKASDKGFLRTGQLKVGEKTISTARQAGGGEVVLVEQRAGVGFEALWLQRETTKGRRGEERKRSGAKKKNLNNHGSLAQTPAKARGVNTFQTGTSPLPRKKKKGHGGGTPGNETSTDIVSGPLARSSKKKKAQSSALVAGA